MFSFVTTTSRQPNIASGTSRSHSRDRIVACPALPVKRWRTFWQRLIVIGTSKNTLILSKPCFGEKNIKKSFTNNYKFYWLNIATQNGLHCMCAPGMNPSQFWAGRSFSRKDDRSVVIYCTLYYFSRDPVPSRTCALSWPAAAAE